MAAKQRNVVTSTFIFLDAVCEFPIALQNSEWVLKYYKPATKENRTLTFGVSGVSNWLITAQGDRLNEYTCINNTENVYVLKYVI